ncbi:hypothetical protein [Pectobacterium phage CX5]|uniref:Uncharacterized protein n=1 Tax=Pectobacterium phage CX5 TaxID=2652426 RepID=A0A5P8D4Q1_9CAUD|nr:hypothetical protein [Pectobacterium phage CX5]QFP93656.1 hypothetical protein [Pectobacterium phage CX5-1]
MRLWGISITLTAVLCGVKLVGWTAASWWAMFSPVLVVGGLWLGVYVLMFLAFLIGWILAK